MEVGVVSSSDDRYLREKEVAALTGLSRAWLQRSRWAGQGPPFTKIGEGKGGAVLYKKSALLAWLDARTTKTHDGGQYE